MAKIKQGILGGFSGKVANVVGTSWKGRAVMKSQPLSVANPRTELQVGQRNKFSKIAELASKVLTQFVQPVENPVSGNISGYNLFCKDNKGAFDAAGALVVENLVCGGGKIANLTEVETPATVSGGEVVIHWQNAADTSALRLTDKVYMVGINTDNGELVVASGVSTREDCVANLVPVNANYTPKVGDEFALLYACVSADGRDVSVKTAAMEVSIED